MAYSKNHSLLIWTFFIIFQFLEWSEAAAIPPTSLGHVAGPLPSASTQSKPRYIRSCGNQVIHSILNACNKNHKRSPIVMNFVFVEYYSPQRSDASSSHASGGQAGSDFINNFLLDPRVSPWVLENEEVFMVMSLQDDPVQKSDVDHDTSDHHNDSPQLPAGASRELPRRTAYMHSIMEKCCTTGCTSVDFTSFC